MYSSVRLPHPPFSLLSPSLQTSKRSGNWKSKIPAFFPHDTRLLYTDNRPKQSRLNKKQPREQYKPLPKVQLTIISFNFDIRSAAGWYSHVGR